MTAYSFILCMTKPSGKQIPLGSRTVIFIMIGTVILKSNIVYSDKCITVSHSLLKKKLEDAFRYMWMIYNA